MYRETKLTDSNQTQVPAEVRTLFNAKPGDIVVWEGGEDGTLTVRIRKKHADEMEMAEGLFSAGRVART